MSKRSMNYMNISLFSLSLSPFILYYILFIFTLYTTILIFISILNEQRKDKYIFERMCRSLMLYYYLFVTRGNAIITHGFVGWTRRGIG